MPALIEYVPDFQPDLFDARDPDEEAEQFFPQNCSTRSMSRSYVYNIEHMLEDTFSTSTSLQSSCGGRQG